MSGRTAHRIALTQTEREELIAITEIPYDDQEPFEVVRAKIVLMAADGKDNQRIAATLNISDSMVSQWRCHWLHYPQLTPYERCQRFSNVMRQRTHDALEERENAAST